MTATLKQHQHQQQRLPLRDADAGSSDDDDRAAEARELATLLSDDDNDDERDGGGRGGTTLFVESVMTIVSKMEAAGDTDELSVVELRAELMQLPREAGALSLVHLLNELDEAFVPRDAVRQIWRKLTASGGGNSAGAAGNGTGSSLKTAKRARSAGAIPIVRSRLLESKRKQAECDLKLLQNRILLLQQEESKAWKKIVQTKDRAAEILQIREANVKRQEQKSRDALQRELETRSEQRRHHSLQKESVVKKKHAAITMISKKYQDVELVKSESRRLKAERERLQLEDVARAREKRESVRRHEDALKRKKLRERAAQDQRVALRLLQQVTADDRAIRAHERRVDEMERTERELIERLHGTQLLQREAFSVLEHALLRADVRRLPSHAHVQTHPSSTASAFGSASSLHHIKI